MATRSLARAPRLFSRGPAIVGSRRDDSAGDDCSLAARDPDELATRRALVFEGGRGVPAAPVSVFDAGHVGGVDVRDVDSRDGAIRGMPNTSEVA